MYSASLPRRDRNDPPSARAGGEGRAPELALLYGHIAGALFVCGSLLGVPASLVLNSGPAPEMYLLTLLGVVSGLVCLALPWERIALSRFHLVAVVATFEIALVVGLVGPQFSFYFLLIAVFVAYVMQSRRDVAVHLGFITLAILAPLVYDPGASRDTLTQALVAIPSLTLVAALVVVLREQLADSERAYRRFAEEALGLVGRIRGQLPLGQSRRSPSSEAEWGRAFAAPAERFGQLVGPEAAAAAPGTLTHRRRVTLLALAGVLAMPLFGAGLAVAGVALPDPVMRTYEAIGIEFHDDGAQRPPAAAAPAARDLGQQTARAVEAVARSGVASRAPTSDAGTAAGTPAAETGSPAGSGQAGPPAASAPASGDAASGQVASSVTPSAPLEPTGSSQVSATPGSAATELESDAPNAALGGALDALGLFPDENQPESGGGLPLLGG